jgi:hypothetical protein
MRKKTSTGSAFIRFHNSLQLAPLGGQTRQDGPGQDDVSGTIRLEVDRLPARTGGQQSRPG